MSFTFAAPNAVHYNAASVKQVLADPSMWNVLCELQKVITGWCALILWLLRYPPRPRRLPGCPQARSGHCLWGWWRHQEVLCLLRVRCWRDDAAVRNPSPLLSPGMKWTNPPMHCFRAWWCNAGRSHSRRLLSSHCFGMGALYCQILRRSFHAW